MSVFTAGGQCKSENQVHSKWAPLLECEDYVLAPPWILCTEILSPSINTMIGIVSPGGVLTGETDGDAST